MRWPVFLVVAFLALTLQVGLGTLLELGGVSPNLVWVLAVFVALWAPGGQAAWAVLILGLVLDLQPVTLQNGGVVRPIVGPYALGFLAGAYALFQVRAVFHRDSPLAMPVAVLAAGLIMQMIVVALLTARGLPFLASDPIAHWHWAEQLLRRFLELLYSAAAALPVGFLLRRTASAWGFEGVRSGSTYAWRG